jgi:hypothetical protein
MALMIAAKLFAVFVSILLGLFVSRTDKAEDATVTTVISTQFPPAVPLAWTAWSGYMQSDAAMENTLDKVLNDTGLNPEPNPRTVYTPRKYIYEVACDQTGLVIGSSKKEFAVSYSPPHNCWDLFVILPVGGTYDWDIKSATRRLVSSDVNMMVAPIWYPENKYMELEPYLYANNSKSCFAITQLGSYFYSIPKDGITSLPSTDSTRCQYGTDDSFIMASTSIKFAVNRLNDFDKVTTLIFDDPSSFPLLESMRTVINSGTFLKSSSNDTIVILTRMSSNVDILMCASAFFNQKTNTGLLCTYLVVATISTKPQQWDPTTPAEFKRVSSNPLDAFILTNKNEIRVYHIPLEVIDTMYIYSTSHLLKATTDAAVYLASLGHNVGLNSDAEKLYVFFDTVESKDAFEVPTTLLIVVGVLTLMCGFAWLISEIRYGPVFNGSLYKVIYEEIKSKGEVKSNKDIGPNEETESNEEGKSNSETKLIEETKPDETIKTPMLMDCTHEPLAFEGYQVVPDLDKPSGRSSQEQEYPMDDLRNEPTEQAPTPQVSILQPPNLQPLMLQNIPTQSPQSPPGSLVAHTPTMTPTHLVSIASLDIATVSSDKNEPTSLPSQSFTPISSAPIPQRPFANSRIHIRASSTQTTPLPPPHTKISHGIQETHSLAFLRPPSVHDPPTESSTLIHNPF